MHKPKQRIETESEINAPSVSEVQNELKQFFKNCVLPRDKEKLKEKLKESVSYRRELVHCIDTNFEESFSFYFVSPDLVININFVLFVIYSK